MKPKLWDGPDAVGEARARFNEVIDTPYTSASGPGFRARKMGAFSEVTLDEPTEQEILLPRFYSMGRIDGPNKLSSSMTAKGTFRKAGEVISNDFATPNIAYLGGQYGAVPRLDGGDTWSFLITTNGKRFKQAVQFDSYFNPGQGAIWALAAGSQRGNRRRTLRWGFTANVGDGSGGGYSQYWGYNAATKEWTAGANLAYPGFITGFIAQRITPSRYAALTSVFRMVPATEDGSNNLVDPNPGGAPWPFLQVSEDFGVAWSYISLDSLFSDFAQHVPRETYNSYVAALAARAAWLPISPTNCLMVLPFVKHVGFDVHGYDENVGYEYRVYRLIGSSVSYVTTLDTAQVRPDEDYVASAIDTSHRKYQIIEFTSFTAARPHVLAVSEDGGLTWVYRRKPWATGYSGFCSWLDEDVLACCVWDGENSLYESLDVGATWAKRATIRSDSTPPSPTDNYMTNFSILRQFRNAKNEAAPCTPGAPWVSDPSVEYVPPT